MTGPAVDGRSRRRAHNIDVVVDAMLELLGEGRAWPSAADIAEIVTTDTVPITVEKRLPNMKILSVAPLLGEAIRRIHVGASVSGMFDVTE